MGHARSPLPELPALGDDEMRPSRGVLLSGGNEKAPLEVFDWGAGRRDRSLPSNAIQKSSRLAGKAAGLPRLARDSDVDERDLGRHQLAEKDVGMVRELSQAPEDLVRFRMRPPRAVDRLARRQGDDVGKPLVLEQEQPALRKLGEDPGRASIHGYSRLGAPRAPHRRYCFLGPASADSSFRPPRIAVVLQ
jgi:hypothetical protein